MYSLEKNLEKENFQFFEPIMTPAKSSQSALVLLGEEHSGRDEMNLAGNPFALLQAASRAGQSLIQYEFERQLPNGKVVRASWEVNGHAELGLPGPNEELLYLVLLQITREVAGGAEWPRMVNFGRGDMLKRLGWGDDSATYRKLSESFLRLSNVTINAKNSFWNARAKAPYETVSFHLLEDFGIAPEPRGPKSQDALPLSWFRWNETLHDSFLAGNVRSLALDFVLSLDGPISRRLFRLLDMMRCSHKPPLREFSMNLMKLRDRLGMTSYAYASKIKEKLAPAIADLNARGYLSDVEFRKSEDGEVAIFTFAPISVTLSGPANPAAQSAKKGRKTPHLAPRETFLEASKADTGVLSLEKAPGVTIYPNEAYAVFTGLPEAEKEDLRSRARAEIEPAFWDRLENPDSPMALSLWELVQREYPEKFEK